jgi:hypothetical protein
MRTTIVCRSPESDVDTRICIDMLALLHFLPAASTTRREDASAVWAPVNFCPFLKKSLRFKRLRIRRNNARGILQKNICCHFSRKAVFMFEHLRG